MSDPQEKKLQAMADELVVLKAMNANLNAGLWAYRKYLTERGDRDNLAVFEEIFLGINEKLFQL